MFSDLFTSFFTSFKMAVAGLFLASSAQVSGPAAAPVPAPEFTGVSHWLNGAPQSMSALRGKVVLVDFWTYTCINCIHTLPFVKQWDQAYRDKGLVVVGVHTPEFPVERQTGNVAAAIKRFGIEYPVAQDNDYATWDAYGNRYWPALYLIDRQGNIVYRHFGEGRYEETEAEIQRLLAQP